MAMQDIYELGKVAAVLIVGWGLIKTHIDLGNRISSQNAKIDAKWEAKDKEYNARFDAVNQRFDTFNQRFDVLNQRFDNMHKEIMELIKKIK